MATEDRELATRPQGGSPAVRQLVAIYRNIPVSRKIMMAAVVVLVMAQRHLLTLDGRWVPDLALPFDGDHGRRC